MKVKPFVIFLEGGFQYMLVEKIEFDYNLLPIHVTGQLFEIDVNTGKVEELGEHEAQFSITLDAIWDRE